MSTGHSLKLVKKIKSKKEKFSPPLDKGIENYVIFLRSHDVNTYESCEGAWTWTEDQHSYPEPTIRFHGDKDEGYRALGIALEARLPVYALRRIWTIIEGEPTGPYWEMVFWRCQKNGKR